MDPPAEHARHPERVLARLEEGWRRDRGPRGGDGGWVPEQLGVRRGGWTVASAYGLNGRDQEQPKLYERRSPVIRTWG